MAANNAAPLQPLPEFHTTVSSVNFECTRILPLSLEEEEEEDSRPDRIASTNREEEEEGRGRISESSCVPLRRTTFLVVRQIRSNLIIVSASPSPFSLLHLLLLLPHIFVIIGCLRIQLHVGLAQLATVFHANVSFFR